MIKNALKVTQTFALDLGLQQNIKKSSLISLTKGDALDPSDWNKEIIEKMLVYRHLGAPLGVKIFDKQRFD